MPASTTPPISSALGRHVARGLDYAVHYAVELFLITLIIYLCILRGLSFNVEIYDPGPVAGGGEVLSEAGLGNLFGGFARNARARLASFSETAPAALPAATPAPAPASPPVAAVAAVPVSTGPDDFTSVARTDDPAPHISNLTLVLSPDYGERKGLPREIIRAKRQRVQHYLDRYAETARREMRDFGIPASITLAQGLLESNAGDSKLAVKSNNHFGIKCRTKCLGCTCRNYRDDSRYDMFRVFESVAESFREHSELLNTKRYARLKQYGKDYRKWAHGLKACGYATDKRYGHKLVTIIENLGLDRYDEL